MMNGYRRAAMTLRALGAADREWLLSQLLPEERGRIATLIEELDKLDPDAEMQALSDLVRDDVPEPAPPSPELLSPSGPVAVVAQAQPEMMARVLANEPDWLVARVCAIARWPWLPAFIAQLDSVRATRIAALMREAPPAKRTVERALMVAMETRLQGDAHRNGFDGLLKAEQLREAGTRGLRSRLARWLR